MYWLHSDVDFVLFLLGIIWGVFLQEFGDDKSISTDSMLPTYLLDT